MAEAFTGSEPRVRAKTVACGDLSLVNSVWGTPLDLAWFIERPPHDQAYLYQQGWRGPAAEEG